MYSRHSVDLGAAGITAGEKPGEKRGKSMCLSPIFLLAVFCTAPQLTEQNKLKT